MGKMILHFIVYSNAFIGLCAMALSLETFVLFDLPFSINWYLLLIFLCTLFIYSLHYYVKSFTKKNDSRLQWCRNNRALLRLIVFTSALLCIGIAIIHYRSLFLATGQFNVYNLTCFLFISVLSLAYSYPILPGQKKSLRRVGWLKMASLSFIWSFATVIVPLLLAGSDQPKLISRIDIAALFTHRFLFIASLGFLFNILDYEEDKKDGITTAAVWLGPAKSLSTGKWLTISTGLISSGWLIHQFNLYRPAFYAALAFPVILLFLSFSNPYKSNNEAVIVLRYDGLMIVKAMLLIFAVAISSV